MDAIKIFRFLKAKAATGATALVTVTRVSGSSMRNPGAHLAVAADGAWCGSLSGGCIETAVIAEAMEALAAGAPREVRFGTGSPYIDIRLPCGGSLDILISPDFDPSVAEEAVALLEARRPFVLRLPFAAGGVSIEPAEPGWRTWRSPIAFEVSHLPALGIVIIGHGASVEALASQARTLGAEPRVLTPDRSIATRMSADGTPVTLLGTPNDRVTLGADPWTAIAFLFHDHDWETELLIAALASHAFYVGAMGGRIAHARRKAALADAGVLPDSIARLRAPIGLIPSSREPQVLALSALAEIVRDFGHLIDREDIADALNTAAPRTLVSAS